MEIASAGNSGGCRRCARVRFSVARARGSAAASIRTRRCLAMSDPCARIAQAYLEACRAELHALKPGNVHIYADGHGMTVSDFEQSANVSAPIMSEPGLSVGARIHGAIRRTHDAVGSNTNLGIVLLCAPLASAAFAADVTGDLRSALHTVLASLTVEDAEQTFAAIRLAAPAGLGESAAQDV